MKASLKFREDQKKPLFRAKVPLSILGLPFQSGLSAGDSKELCLSLGTLFESGPAFRVAYRPNDSANPFSLLLKTGIGALGSSIDAPMTMTAEFSLLGGPRSSSPAFFLHFKPQFGDFSVRKSQSSTEFAHRIDPKRQSGDGSSEDEGSVEVVDPPLIGGEYLSVGGGGGGGRLNELATRSSSSIAAVVDTALAGMELGARTVLPIRNGAVLKLRWGVRFPDDFRSLFAKRGFGGVDPTAGIASRGIPLLVMNKIGIEHVAKGGGHDDDSHSHLQGERIADVADTCFAVRRQMEGLQAETGRMRKAMDDFRSEFVNRGLNGSANCTGRVYGGGDLSDDHLGDEPKKKATP